MPTRFSFENSFRASATEVVAMLQDAAFWDSVLVELKAADHHAGVSRVRGVVTVRLEMREDVPPGLPRRLIGTDELRIVLSQAWTAQTTSELTLAAGDLPLTLSGSQRVVASASATRLEAEGTVTYKKLLIGRFAEKLVAEEFLAELYEVQQRLGDRWLADRADDAHT